MRGKDVKISYDLFFDLYEYILGLEDDSYAHQELLNALESKIEAMTRRKLYCEYKAAQGGTEERERARQAYLDAVGMPSAFRADRELDSF